MGVGEIPQVVCVCVEVDNSKSPEQNPEEVQPVSNGQKGKMDKGD